jgi:hypothetical protein
MRRLLASLSRSWVAGPLLVFTGILYAACRRYELLFLPTYAWVGIWGALFTLVLAFAGVSRVISKFTRFTDEIFAALISIIFVVEAVRNVLAAFPAQHMADDSALLQCRSRAPGLDRRRDATRRHAV